MSIRVLHHSTVHEKQDDLRLTVEVSSDGSESVAELKRRIAVRRWLCSCIDGVHNWY